MTGDVSAMEASLLAVAETGIDIRHALFERFLAAFPERRPAFLNLDAASRRMTDETLQAMLGLAQDEGWVWPQIAELVVTHRNYGTLGAEEYEAFIDMAVDALADAAGAAWSPGCDAAWRDQATALKAMIHRALAEWQAAIPTGAGASAI
ncbi:hypothetical protein [Sphingopyxis sp.]|uniref:hypothetical protein n=1 Tax=Sphingopyxis sp. TaxID=1908224 RepID=UPI0035ADD168